MKKFFYVLTFILAAFAATMPASAQFKYGVKAGVAVNDLNFNTNYYDTYNKAGFTGGVMIEFTVPTIGLGLDFSAMYVHRYVDTYYDNSYYYPTTYNESRDYIELPLNLKWKINLPAMNNIIRPYLATGPSFAFLVSKDAATDFIQNNKCDISWNVGFGVELFKHIQIGASYGFGITKALESVNVVENMPYIEGKNQYWTTTVAYLF